MYAFGSKHNMHHNGQQAALRSHVRMSLQDISTRGRHANMYNDRSQKTIWIFQADLFMHMGHLQSE